MCTSYLSYLKGLDQLITYLLDEKLEVSVTCRADANQEILVKSIERVENTPRVSFRKTK